jgi:hypothetical protein
LEEVKEKILKHFQDLLQVLEMLEANKTVFLLNSHSKEEMKIIPF